MVDITLRKCSECGNDFLVENETDALCDVCAYKLCPNPHHLTRKELEGRNWEDRKIKKQWLNSYSKSEESILSKCKGTNYHN